MTFVVLYENVGFVVALMPSVPSHFVGSRMSPKIDSGSEKSVELSRSGALSLVSTCVKPQGANGCVARESNANFAPGSLLTYLVASNARLTVWLMTGTTIL